MKERIRSRPWRVMEKVWEDLGDWDGKPSFKLWAWWWWWWWWFPLCLWTVTERLYTTGWDGTGRELWTTAFTLWFFPSNQIINQNPMCNFLNFFSYYPLHYGLRRPMGFKMCEKLSKVDVWFSLILTPTTKKMVPLSLKWPKFCVNFLGAHFRN